MTKASVNRMQLTDREWKEFNLISSQMFYLDEVKTVKSTSEAIASEKYDVVGATSKNNGNVGFLGESYKKLLCEGNCICLIKTGQGSVGDAVYKSNCFIPSNNVCLIRSKWLNKYNGMFIVAEINKQSDRYSYGYIRNNQRIAKEKVMLPVDTAGKPDYAFMEEYVKDQVNKKKKEYLDYAKKTVAKLEYKEIPSLEEKEWGEFFISDICNIESGQDIYDAERIIGKTPYITSTASNNGIKYFVDNSNKTLEAGAISVNRNGSVGYCFYHKYNALYSNDCRKLRLIIGNNEYISIFITNRITQQREKYNYGYKMGTGRLKRQKILLPVNESGQPDYAYMEQYVKNIMNTQLNKYLCYSNL